MNGIKIKAPKGQELLIFLFFLLVSCCLWLMLTLNRYYETDIDFTVKVTNIPDKAGFVSSDEAVVRVTVKDVGMTIMNYGLETFLPVNIDYKELKENAGTLAIPVASIVKRIEGQLRSTTTIVQCTPDSLFFYTRRSARLFPVKVEGVAVGARQYFVDDIKSRPDSVLVFAPSSITDTLSYVRTQYFEQRELRDTTTLDAMLIHNSQMECMPSVVKVVIPVTPYAEKSFELPVIGVGFPDNMTLKTFPSRVKVVADVSLSNFDDVSAKDFEVIVNYDDVSGDDVAERVKLGLLKYTDSVLDVRIVPSEVEYLIDVVNK